MGLGGKISAGLKQGALESGAVIAGVHLADRGLQSKGVDFGTTQISQLGNATITDISSVALGSVAFVSGFAKGMSAESRKENVQIVVDKAVVDGTVTAHTEKGKTSYDYAGR